MVTRINFHLTHLALPTTLNLNKKFSLKKKIINEMGGPWVVRAGFCPVRM